MNLAKYLSVSLIALSAGATSAGEFYQNGPTASLLESGLEQSSQPHVIFPGNVHYDYLAGQFIGTFGTSPDGFLRFFCFEDQPAGSPYNPTDYTLNSTPVMVTAAAYKSLQQLYDVYYPRNGFTDFYDAGKTTFGVFKGNLIGTGTSADTDAAAFQLAVWEIILGPTGFSDDGSSFAGETTTMLGNLGTSTGWQNWTVYTLTNPTEQDYVTATYHVPEPGSLVLVAAALMGLGFARRSRS